jgi:cation transport regulator ChaB
MHPESEHGLRVQLATALREHNLTQEALGAAFEDLRAADKRAARAEAERDELKVALAAARRECEGLISSVMHLRLVGTQMATFIEEQMPLFGGASSEFDGEGEPREILKRWRKADKIADKSYALAAPAAGEEG